jgi:hypothetical protein
MNTNLHKYFKPIVKRIVWKIKMDSHPPKRMSMCEELAKYKHDFKTNCEEDYGEIKMYLYACTQKNPNVVRFGYVFRHVCGNLLGVLTTC